MGSIATPSTDLLQSALDEARTNYATEHPTSKRDHDEACKYMPGGNTRTVLHTSPFPLTIDSARSCYLRTIDGQEYIDFLGEYTAGVYGHNHPVIREAIEKALDGGWNYGGHSKTEQEFAKTICSRFPVIEKVRFVNSGTEANMMALATALAYAKLHYPAHRNKTKILIFESSYHGSTISGRGATLAAATDPSAPTINLPHDFIVAPYNDPNTVASLLSALPRNSLAAILVEPLLGSGGCFPSTSTFLSTLRSLATQHSALLIFDEVMTSRLSYSGFHTAYGVKPDLMTLGKYLGGGMSFGAFGGRGDIMGLYDPRTKQLEHPGTFNNNVFTMHAGIAGCALLTPERINSLNNLGDTLRLRIETVLEKHHVLQEGTVPSAPVNDSSYHRASHPARPPKLYVKGVGSLLCIHFAGPEKDVLQGLFWHHMLGQGIYMAQRGFISLSIEITETHIDRFVGAIDSFVRQWDMGGVLRWEGFSFS